jgi:hypothetical protein
MSMATVAVAVSVAAAAGLIVPGLTSVAMVASLGTASLVARSMASVVRRGSQAGSTVRLALGSTLTLGVLLVSLLLVLRLGRVFIAQGLGSGNSPDCRSLLSKVGTWHGAAWATETVGSNVR